MDFTLRSSAWALMALLLASPALAGNLLWIVGGRPSRQTIEVLETLRHADVYGLVPESYTIEMPSRQVQLIVAGHADPGLQARFDAALVRSVSQFVSDLHRGRVSAEAAGFHLPAGSSRFDAAKATRQLATTDDMLQTLESLEPRLQPYRSLKGVLAEYQELARRPDLHRLPPLPGRSVRVGDEFAGTPQLRKLLLAVGDLDAAELKQSADARIDAALEAGVRRFQYRHGLLTDGIIGRQTYAELTTPLAARVRQIELTLERWRWLSQLPRPDIVVNIPQFMLYALPRAEYREQEVLEMPVIVGQSHTRTPVFAAAIEQVIFHPFWDVPASIVRKELLPKIRKDPRYLAVHHFDIVRGPGDDARVVEASSAAIDALAAGHLRLRQRPGPDNALGPVKFVLPNPYDVRVHGTPKQELFTLSGRALSHGCVRVSDPAALAGYVLKSAPGSWDASAIEAAICGTQSIRVNLNRPVRVVVFYATAAATERHGVLFSKDIYGHDRTLAQLLDGKTKSPMSERRSTSTTANIRGAH